MKNKRIYPVIAALLLGVSGCSSAETEFQKNQERSAQEASKTIVWRPVIPENFAQAVSAEKWESAVNSILKNRGKDYTVDVEFLIEDSSGIPDQIKVLKEQQAQTDVITLLQQTISLEQPESLASTYMLCVRNDLLYDLGGWLGSEDSLTLRNALTEADLQNAEIDGSIYGISAVLPRIHAAAYDCEVMEMLGIEKEDLNSHLADNRELFEIIRDTSDVVPFQMRSADLTIYQSSWVDYEARVLCLDQQGEYVNLLETQEYQSELENMKDWKDEGLLALSADSSGAFALPAMELGIENCRTDSYVAAVNAGGQTREYYIVPDPEYPYTAPYWGDNKTALASWSQQKEEALDFLTLLMSDQQLADYFAWGTEGTDYAVLDDGRIYVLPGASDFVQLFGYQYTNPLAASSSLYMPTEKIEQAAWFHQKYESFIPRGFRLDLSSASHLLQDISRNSTAMNRLLALDFANADDVLDPVLDQLNQDGMNDIVKEANQQLNAWRNSQASS